MEKRTTRNEGKAQAGGGRLHPPAFERGEVTAHRTIETPLDGKPRSSGELALTMPPPSLNNLFANGSKGRFKTSAYTTWQTMAHLELRKFGSWHVAGPVKIVLAFNRKETKADLDNLVKPILDLLVGAGRISDDRNVACLGVAFSGHVKGTAIRIEAIQ